MNNQDKNTYVKTTNYNYIIGISKEKELSDINIGEITKKAQVSRNSFYRTMPQRRYYKKISLSAAIRMG